MVFNLNKASLKKLLIAFSFIAALAIFAYKYDLSSYFEDPVENFLITSHGHTGTTWLTTVLNSHNQIRCAHYIYGFSGSPAIKESLYSNMTVEKYLKSLRTQAKLDLKAMGSIHSFVYSDIRDYLQVNPKLKVVNMVRHPISRVTSAVATWLGSLHDLGIENHEFETETQEYATKVKQKFDVDFNSDIKAKYFLKALAQQDQVYRDMRLAKKDGIKQLKFEDITVDPKALIELISYVSKNKIKLTLTQARTLSRPPAMNRHFEVRQSEQQIYESWQEWQKYAFRLHLQNNENGLLYQDFNYSLEFVSLS